MRRLIIAIIFLISTATAAHSQFYAGAGIGASVTKARFVGELQIGQIFEHNWFVQGSYQAHIDAEYPALLQLQAGKRLMGSGSSRHKGVSVSGGYCYQLVSTDNTARNKNTFVVSAAVFKHRRVGELVYSGTFSPGYFILGVGLRGLF